jgi:hypothetical protein
MRLLIHVDVKGLKQAKAIERALQQPDVKAYATAIGVLDREQDDPARDRALSFVLDYFASEKTAHPVVRDELHETRRPPTSKASRAKKEKKR